jgi:hypothetical protein
MVRTPRLTAFMIRKLISLFVLDTDVTCGDLCWKKDTNDWIPDLAPFRVQDNPPVIKISAARANAA